MKLKAVVFAGIGDHLSRNAQHAQAVIKLPSLAGRDALIRLTVQNQRIRP